MLTKVLAIAVAALALPAGSSAAAPRWTFTAQLDAVSQTLAVRACSDVALDEVEFAPGVRGAGRFRSEARRDSSATLVENIDRLRATHWQRGECLLTRVDLAGSAKAERQRFAYNQGHYFVLDPGRWLWRPQHIDPDSTIAFDLPEGWSVSVPWHPVEGRANTYRLGPTAADWPALTAFGRFEQQAIALPGGVLRVSILPPWDAKQLHRVEPVARALAGAYDRLPRDDAQVLIVPIPGERGAAPWGQVTRGGGSAVHLFVGAEAAPDALIEDWTATHEFSHLLHPYLSTRGRWLGEGLASYYQNVLRARVGELSANEAWRRLEAGFGRGRADRNAAGLTLEQAAREMGRRRAHMRVYWSGAAFWLEADLALRERGSSLDAVLRDHSICCLSRTVYSTPEAYAEALDRVAGADIFTSRHRRYAASLEFPTPSMPHDRLVASEAGRAIMRGESPPRASR
jgi:hypothetical protein